MGGKCCKKTAAVEEPAAPVVDKIKEDAEAEKVKAAEAKEAKLAATKAEGEKLQGEINDLEGKIQEKKDAGCVRDESLTPSKEVLSQDSSAVESAEASSESGSAV